MSSEKEESLFLPEACLFHESCEVSLKAVSMLFFPCVLAVRYIPILEKISPYVGIGSREN